MGCAVNNMECGTLAFKASTFRVLILSGNFHLSFPTTALLHVWVVSCVGYVHVREITSRKCNW